MWDFIALNVGQYITIWVDNINFYIYYKSFNIYNYYFLSVIKINNASTNIINQNIIGKSTEKSYKVYIFTQLDYNLKYCK